MRLIIHGEISIDLYWWNGSQTTGEEFPYSLLWITYYQSYEFSWPRTEHLQANIFNHNVLLWQQIAFPIPALIFLIVMQNIPAWKNLFTKESIYIMGFIEVHVLGVIVVKYWRKCPFFTSGSKLNSCYFAIHIETYANDKTMIGCIKSS